MCGRTKGVFESRSGREGSQASIPKSKEGFRVVGSRGASRMDCQSASKVT